MRAAALEKSCEPRAYTVTLSAKFFIPCVVMPNGVLFVHNNFPGQFADLAGVLAARGVQTAAIAQNHAVGLEGVRIAKYAPHRGSTPGLLPFAIRAEADMIRGAGAFRAAKALKAEGWDPAVIVAHPGWGESLFLQEIFPHAKLIADAEFLLSRPRI